MNILVACEFSGVVRQAFQDKGHSVWSCDLLPSDDNSGNHYQGDVEHILDFRRWDMLLAFPPCTYLTVTANRSFVNNPERWKNRYEAMIFVHRLLNLPIDKICLENPQGVISTHIRKPDQYIQPYEHGHKESKKTGLWLKGLPLLLPTHIVEPNWVYPKNGGKRMSETHYKNGHTGNNIERMKVRSKTYQGIADAMADQWGVR